MTINAGAPKRQDFTGTGIAGPFPITIPISSANQLKVIRTLISSGVEEVLVLGTDFNVKTDLSSLTLTEALANTHKLSLLLDPVLQQNVDFLAGSSFPSDVVERVVDDLCRQIIKINEEQGRCVRLADSSPLTTGVTIEDPVAGKFLAVDATGTKIVMSDIDASVIDDSLDALALAGAGLADVITVADNIADVQTVAGMEASVVSLASLSPVLTAVNGMASDITTVIGLQTAMNAALTAVRPETVNYIWNGNFQLWRGYTAARATTALKRMYPLDGWSCAKVSYGTGVTCTQIAQNDNSPFNLRVQRDSAQTFTDMINLVFNLAPDECYSLAGQDVVVSFRGKCGANFSGASGQLLVDVMYTTSSVIQPITADDGTYTTGGGVAGTLTATLTTSFQKFVNSSTVITIPSGAKQVALRFRYVPTGTAGANDWFEINDVYLCRGRGDANPRPLLMMNTNFNAIRQWKRTYNSAHEDGKVVTVYTGGLSVLARTTLGSDLMWSLFYGDVPFLYTPTITTYSNGGTSGSYGQTSGTTGTTSTADAGMSNCLIFGASGATTIGSTYTTHISAEARL